LLFNIINSIDYNSTNRWFAAPQDLKVRLVCAETGQVPGDFCEHQIADYFIPLVSAIQKCTHAKEVAVQVDEALSYCTSCLPQGGYKKKVYPNFSPELIAYFESTGVAYVKIPPHNPACTRIFDSQAPLIVSPANGQEYIVDSQSAELMLSCQAHNEVKKVYWYINDRLYTSAAASEKVFFKPTTGPVKISCSDDKGRNSDVKIMVRAE
jgi:penicillin-binding protein 1C